MLLPLQRFPSVGRAICSRRHYILVLLGLGLVCIVLQTLVARQTSNDKGSFPFPLYKPHSFSLQSFWEKFSYNSALGDLNHTTLYTEEDWTTAVTKSRNTATATRNSATKSRMTATKSRMTATKPRITATKPRITSSSQSSSSSSAPGECREKTHLVFLKTHKTASSTILNILYRFGERRNLTFALPANRNSQLFYPHLFAPHFVQGVTNNRFSEFHIMCNHMRFKKSEVAKVMPRNTFYFSILRNPVSMAESIFIYYKSIQAFNGKRTLDEFLNSSWTQYNSSVANNHYAHNILAFDFGFSNNATSASPDLEEQVSDAITGIERDFHLILINEYFYESMVLLKHSLCWSLEDVASFKLNSRSDRTRRNISSETTEKIKKWNALDWRIYLHFNATFWRKLDSLMGRQQLEEEVSELKAVQTKLAEVCLKEKGAVDPSKIKDAALKPFQYGAAVIQGYILNSDMDNRTREKCEGLIRPELQYTNKLYTSQFQEGHKHLIKRRFTYFRAPRSARGPHNNATAP